LPAVTILRQIRLAPVIAVTVTISPIVIADKGPAGLGTALGINARNVGVGIGRTDMAAETAVVGIGLDIGTSAGTCLDIFT